MATRKRKNSAEVADDIISTEQEVSGKTSEITLTLDPEPFDAASYYAEKTEDGQQPIIMDASQPIDEPVNVEQPISEESVPAAPVSHTTELEQLSDELNQLVAGLNKEERPQADEEVVLYEEPMSFEIDEQLQEPLETQQEVPHAFVEAAQGEETAEETVQSEPQQPETVQEDIVKTKDYNAEAIREEDKQEKTMTKHVELKQVKRKKKKTKVERLGFNWFFWISFVIILIPIIYFVALLLDASDKTSTPLVGERPEYDLRYVIEDSSLSTVKSSVETIEGVEKVYINLAVETLRVNIDVRDDLTDEQIRAVLEEAYGKVGEVLPIETYFTIYQTYKQYDLEIGAYNNIEFTDDFKYMALVRNSNMESYSILDLNTPLNPDLYAQLLQEAEEERLQEQEESQQSESSEEG